MKPFCNIGRIVNSWGFHEMYQINQMQIKPKGALTFKAKHCCFFAVYSRGFLDKRLRYRWYTHSPTKTATTNAISASGYINIRRNTHKNPSPLNKNNGTSVSAEGGEANPVSSITASSKTTTPMIARTLCLFTFHFHLITDCGLSFCQ